MKHALTALSALLLACALPSIGWAHGATHPQHGGIVQMNGETLFELVRAPAGVSLYVMDEDEPVHAKGMTAKLSVTVAGKRREVPMVSGAGNQFVARGLTLPKGASVGVLVVNNASQARYGTTFIIKK
jgi:hypothetical protein